MENRISLGDVELELMTILWHFGEGSVRDVMDKLKSPRAYTSVSTMLRLLERKGFVASHKIGKTHKYYAQLQQSDYQKSIVKTIVKHVFNGTPQALVNTLITSEQVDLQELAALVDALKKENQK